MLTLTLAAAAAPPASDDRDTGPWHLLRPVPRASMREMSTDRPDVTESPVTVDAGHYQVELDAVSVTREAGASELAVGIVNLKAGLTESSDLQLIVESLRRSAGRSELGDLTLRYKQNLWGNDGGATAFGLIPYVTLLTESEPEIEAGLLAPLAIAGPGGWGFGVMLELDAVRREAGHALELLASATAARAVWRDLGAFFELASTLPLDAEDLAMSGNTGLTLALSGDVVLDAGVRVGLTEAAEDLVVFVGGSARY